MQAERRSPTTTANTNTTTTTADSSMGPYDSIDAWRTALESLFQASGACSAAAAKDASQEAVVGRIDAALAVLFIPHVTRVTVDEQAIGYEALRAQMVAVAAAVAAGAQVAIEARAFEQRLSPEKEHQFSGIMRVIVRRRPGAGLPPLRMVDVHMAGDLDAVDGRAATFDMRSMRVDVDDSESD